MIKGIYNKEIVKENNLTKNPEKSSGVCVFS